MLRDRKASKMNRKKLNIISLERDESGEIESMVVTMERADLDVTDEGTKLTAQNLMNYLRDLYEEDTNDNTVIKGTESGEAKSNVILDSIIVPDTITENLNLPGYNLVSWQIKSASIPVSLTNEGYTLDVTQTSNNGTICLTAICTIDGIPYDKTFDIYYIIPGPAIFMWDQMKEGKNSNFYLTSGEEFDKDINLEITSSDTDALITYNILGNGNRKVKVLFTETDKLRNLNKINQTDTFNFSIRVIDATNPAKTLKTEEVKIYYKYYSIPDFYGELTQEVGNRQSIYFTLVPRKDVPIYLEVYNYESALFSIIQPYVNPNTNNIEFGFIEHPDLNSSYFTGPLNAEFLVRVYSDEARTNLICTVPGNITYNFVQIRPID